MADDTDDILDNWEDEDTEVLERRMEDRRKQQEKEKKKIAQPRPPSVKSQEGGDVPATSLEIQTHLPLRTQDAGRTEYVAPIKILRRQADAKTSSSHSTQSNTSGVPRKSLAEREADYASARARILGSGYGGEDSTSPNSTPSPAQQKHTSSSSRGQGDVGDLVKRQPKGPNGTKGFKSQAKS